MAQKETVIGSNESELEAISNVLFNEEVHVHHLLTEVVWSACHFLKKNPTATIEDAMDYGYNEWIK
jgi:hypothetical protein